MWQRWGWIMFAVAFKWVLLADIWAVTRTKNMFVVPKMKISTRAPKNFPARAQPCSNQKRKKRPPTHTHTITHTESAHTYIHTRGTPRPPPTSGFNHFARTNIHNSWCQRTVHVPTVLLSNFPRPVQPLGTLPLMTAAALGSCSPPLPPTPHPPPWGGAWPLQPSDDCPLRKPYISTHKCQ